nr:hypothetical protein [Tanacetum cinerariifolium]
MSWSWNMWHGNSLLYHEELSILRGRKSVPGMNSRERGNEKKRTTLSSRADDGSFKVTPFKVPDLNVKLDFKIDLIVFGPDIRSAPSSGQNNTFDDDVDEPSVKDLALSEDHVFQADQCDAFDSNVDEAPTVQTMFMANLSSANPIYDEVGPSYDSDILSKVALGYENPLYLTNAMQVQSSLYNGHELVKTNHALAVVHDSEDTLELAEITKKKMPMKMQSPLCVKKKVKIAPLNYSKESYLATFTPQRQLSAEQIFWSFVSKQNFRNDGVSTQYTRKACPRVLPTKSQVKFNIYTLTQLFLEFDKTCKNRITPCGLTEGEREVKEIKEIFEQMEAEVEQNAVDKKCAKVERKNILIENENLLADCLSNELLYSVMNAVNTVSRFFELHDAYTIEQARKTGLDEMAMAAFESQYIDKDTYSTSTKDIEVQSCFLDDHLTNLTPPRNCMPPDVLLR